MVIKQDVTWPQLFTMQPPPQGVIINQLLVVKYSSQSKPLWAWSPPAEFQQVKELTHTHTPLSPPPIHTLPNTLYSDLQGTKQPQNCTVLELLAMPQEASASPASTSKHSFAQLLAYKMHPMWSKFRGLAAPPALMTTGVLQLPAT